MRMVKIPFTAVLKAIYFTSRMILMNLWEKMAGMLPTEIYEDEIPTGYTCAYMDGEPVMRDLGNGVSQVANTRYLIALDSADKKYYLKSAGDGLTLKKY